MTYQKIPEWQKNFQERMDSQNPGDLTEEQMKIAEQRCLKILERRRKDCKQIISNQKVADSDFDK